MHSHPRDKDKKGEHIILHFFLNLEVEEILVRKRNEGRGGRFGLTQGGRKPAVTIPCQQES